MSSKFPLHDAVRSGKVETLREKIAEIRKVKDDSTSSTSTTSSSSSSSIDTPDQNGNSALLIAVMSGDASAVQCLLVEGKASPDFAVQRKDTTITPKLVALQREKERISHMTPAQTQFTAEVPIPYKKYFFIPLFI